LAANVNPAMWLDLDLLHPIQLSFNALEEVDSTFPKSFRGS